MLEIEDFDCIIPVIWSINGMNFPFRRRKLCRDGLELKLLKYLNDSALEYCSLMIGGYFNSFSANFKKVLHPQYRSIDVTLLSGRECLRG